MIEALTDGKTTDETQAAYREAIELLSDDPEPYYILGRMYRAQMEFDDALDQQNLAIQRDPTYAPSRYERAVLLSIRHHKRVEELKRDALAAEGRRLASTGKLPEASVG